MCGVCGKRGFHQHGLQKYISGLSMEVYDLHDAEHMGLSLVVESLGRLQEFVVYSLYLSGTLQAADGCGESCFPRAFC